MFQTLILKVLKGLAASTLLTCEDDFSLMGKNASDIFNKMEEKFTHFCAANLRIHPVKCHVAVSRV